MDKYKPTIGLEIHVELKTLTKMFCECRNDPDEARPNVNVCPICVAHPGTLPAINMEAVKQVIKVGLSLGGDIAELTEFDRKNYFYPDIPKDYQISQYKHPIVSGGSLAGISITRVHLEEDTAISMHDKGDYSLLNFNRAGVPLMELVTEPVIHTSSQAVKFAKELQLLLQYLGVAHANMEKGEMRIEANVSVVNQGEPLLASSASAKVPLGTKVEIKNLNSFRIAERAIDYEIKRQAELLERGEKVVQETRGWNDVKQETYSQRQKEESHDYRYFPDPDLPKLDISKITEFDLGTIKNELPETPEGKRARFARSFGIKPSDVEFYISNPRLAGSFERMAQAGSPDFNQILSNWIVSELSNKDEAYFKISESDIMSAVHMFVSGAISSAAVKIIFTELASSNKTTEEIINEKNLIQQTDEKELGKIVDQIIAANQNIVEEYKKGNERSIQFLVGQAMKLSSGSGNPQVLKKILESKLK